SWNLNFTSKGSLCHMSPTFFETLLLEIFLSSATITGSSEDFSEVFGILESFSLPLFSPKDHGACFQWIVLQDIARYCN
ncbi:18076_t:CDS:2, partial [Gigaspora rosea]